MSVIGYRLNAPTRCSIMVLTLVGLLSATALAQSDNPWAGPYLGANLGAAHSSACVTASLQGATVDSSNLATLSNRYCPSGDFIGGVQIGENFQIKRFVWGIGADLDYWSAKDVQQSWKYTGVSAPPGTYSFSGKLAPSGFGIIGPRIGYAGNLMLPYLRAGAAVAIGSHDSTLIYTPPAAAKPTASFSAGPNFATTGWAAGAGTEIGLNGAWSITAEYLRISLGKASRSSAICNGTPADCAAFAGTSLDSNHSVFSANTFRVGFNYWFRYWEP
jgi:outer membrane immunogenic protein